MPPPPPPPKRLAPGPPKTKVPQPAPPPPTYGNKGIKSKSKPQFNRNYTKKKALLSLHSNVKPMRIKKATSAPTASETKPVNIYKSKNGYNKPTNCYKPNTNQKKSKPSPPPPPKIKKNNKNGLSNDRNADKVTNIIYYQPPIASKKALQKSKSVNVDWKQRLKQQRNKMKNGLIKKEGKNENKFAVKRKPQKLEFNLFKKSKSAETINNTHTKKMVPPPPPPDALKRTAKQKAMLPSVPPPKPKANARKVNDGVSKKGVLEVMPSKEANGWVYNRGAMYRVSYKDIDDIKKNNIFEGAPVIFDSMDKNAKHLRLLTQIDINVVTDCLTKKGKTKYDARYYIYDTELVFNGNLSSNAFEMVNCRILSEKIINAFVNTSGGTLYIGIDKSCKIVGVLAKHIDLDRIKRAVMMNVNRFEPKLSDKDLKKFRFTTTAIMTKDGKLCEDIVVVKIIVPGPFKNENNDIITYCTANGDKFQKKLNYIMKVVNF